MIRSSSNCQPIPAIFQTILFILRICIWMQYLFFSCLTWLIFYFYRVLFTVFIRLGFYDDVVDLVAFFTFHDVIVF